MKPHDFEISNSFMGGYKKKDVDAYCRYLKSLLETKQKELADLQQELACIQQEKQALEDKLDKAEVYYRALWEKAKAQEDTLNRQHQLLVQLTDKNPSIAQLSRKLEEWKKKSFELLNTRR